MLFGTIKKLLSSEYKEFDDTILVESPFKETTRDGKEILRLVQLGMFILITLDDKLEDNHLWDSQKKGKENYGIEYIGLSSRAFIIASEHDLTGKNTTTSKGIPLCRESSVIEILSLYPWESIKLSVFKRTKKQSLKASFVNNGIRYFELRDIPKRKIFWSLWCSNIKELNSSKKKWPFSLSSHAKASYNKKTEVRVAECIELRFIKHSEKQKRAKWKDKYLYLGSQREAEDKVRPVPVPGLGRAEEIKLLYLKPRYFGCWEQSEHWVQCGNSSLDIIKQN